MKEFYCAEEVPSPEREEVEKNDSRRNRSFDRSPAEESYDLGFTCNVEGLEEYEGELLPDEVIRGIWAAEKGLQERLGAFNMLLNLGVSNTLLRQCEEELTFISNEQGSDATQRTFLAFIRLKLGASVNFRNLVGH